MQMLVMVLESRVLQMLVDQEFDREVIHASIDAQIEARAELQHAHTDDYLDFIESLDSSQRAEMAGLAESALSRLESRPQDSAEDDRRPRRGR